MDQLWREHRNLAGVVRDLSTQVAQDRAVFSRQIEDLQQRQTEILVEVSKSVEKHDNHLGAAKSEILGALDKLSKRVRDQETQAHYEDGAKQGAAAERKRLIAMFTIVLSGVIAVSGWLITR